MLLILQRSPHLYSVLDRGEYSFKYFVRQDIDRNVPIAIVSLVLIQGLRFLAKIEFSFEPFPRSENGPVVAGMAAYRELCLMVLDVHLLWETSKLLGKLAADAANDEERCSRRRSDAAAVGMSEEEYARCEEELMRALPKKGIRQGSIGFGRNLSEKARTDSLPSYMSKQSNARSSCDAPSAGIKDWQRYGSRAPLSKEAIREYIRPVATWSASSGNMIC